MSEFSPRAPLFGISSVSLFKEFGVVRVLVSLGSAGTLHLYGAGLAMGPYALSFIDSRYYEAVTHDLFVKVILAGFLVYIVDTIVFCAGAFFADSAYVTGARTTSAIPNLAAPISPIGQYFGVILVFLLLYFGNQILSVVLFAGLGALIGKLIFAGLRFGKSRRLERAEVSEADAEKQLMVDENAKFGAKVLYTGLAATVLCAGFVSGVLKGSYLIKNAAPAVVIISGVERSVDIVARTNEFLFIRGTNGKVELLSIESISSVRSR